MKYIEENSRIWDERSENNDKWSIPVTSEMVKLAREGSWSIVLTPAKPVPANWFPDKLEDKKILCLASGGGQQGPILAATGADVTVLDNSIKQLEKDNLVAQRDNLKIRTVQGNMQDLSVFADESFDLTLVLGPMYHLYTKEDKQKAMAEAIRVTKRGGHIFVAYCMNEATMLQFVFGKGNLWNCMENHMLTEDFHCLSEEKDLFELSRVEDINALNEQFSDITRVKLVATDGATNYMRECIDSMDDATFEMWMKYHFTICERQDLIGATHHSLDILQKI